VRIKVILDVTLHHEVNVFQHSEGEFVVHFTCDGEDSTFLWNLGTLTHWHSITSQITRILSYTAVKTSKLTT